MKKWMIGMGAAAFFSVQAFAHPPITVFVDEEELFFDQPPVIQDDRTLVPMRAIFQALGAEVAWEEQSQTITAVSDQDVIVFRIGDAGLYKNGALSYTMTVPAQILNDRTMVPIRAIAESFGAKVDWDGISYTIDIFSEGNSAGKDQQKEQESQQSQDAPAVGGYSEEVRAADGTVVLTAKVDCAVLKGAGSGVEKINTAMANEAFALGKGFLREYQEQALREYATQGKSFMPYYYIGSYELKREGNGYASFLSSSTSYAGGSTKRTEAFSKTFSLSSGKEMQLSDLVDDSTAALEELWRASFTALIKEDEEAFYSDAEKRLEKNLSKVKFYLTDTGIVFYLSPETIAPASSGLISFEVKYNL